MLVATLDACVLYKGTLTNLLLWIANAKAFEPTWSDLIHDEWVRNLAIRIPVARLDHRRRQMDRAFPAASVPGNASLIASIRGQCRTAAHKKDAHVVATAVDARARVIITFNIKDFGTEVLAAHQLRKQRPDAFLLDLLVASQSRMLAGVKDHRESLKRSAPTVDQYLAELSGAKGEVPRFAKALEAHKAVI